MRNSLITLVSLLFLHSLHAQFPVDTLQAIEDSWVDQSRPYVNLNEETGMHIMKNTNGNESRITYLKFDISGLDVTDSAELILKGGNVVERENYDPSENSFIISLKYLENADWKEESLTWNSKPTGKSEVLAEFDVRERGEQSLFVFKNEKLTSYINEKINSNSEHITFTLEGRQNRPGVGAWVSGEKWITPALYFYNKTGNVQPPRIMPGTGAYKNIKLNMKAEPGAIIYYTLDNTIPGPSSPKFIEPFSIKKNAVVTAVAYKGDAKSLFSREYLFLKETDTIDLLIDQNGKQHALRDLWHSTGFSPAEFLLRRDMQQTIELQGSVPGIAVDYVRPHYLLNLVGVENINTKNPQFNWSKLDNVLDVLVANNLKLVFELMGSPSASLTDLSSGFDDKYQQQMEGHVTYFTNFTDKEKVYAWKRLVKHLAAHLIERYGQEEVRSWYFETTNEPDLGIFWKHSIPEFLNYYDACSEGLMEVDPELKFGGPGTAGDLSETFRALLAHCDTGFNYFTGQKGVRIDFISYHVKERPDKMMRREANIISYVQSNHPKFKDLPFINDESDPIVGWSKDLWWRPTPWYAAFLVQSVDLHDKIFVDSMKINYGFLSNDNAFMGNWYNRTQFARFSNPDKPHQFSLIKKPVFTVTSMLGMLGRMRNECDVPKSSNEHFGIIPTVHADNKLAVLVYNKSQIVSIGQKYRTREDTGRIAFENLSVNLNFKNLPFEKYQMIQYRMDSVYSNPYQKWLEMGKPEYPTKEELDTLRKYQELSAIFPPKEVRATDSTFKTTIDMPASSVSLILLVPDNFEGLPAIETLSSTTYTGLNGEKDVLLKWNDLNQNVFTYEVYYTSSLDRKFKKINPVDLVEKAFIHSINEHGVGYYKVRAVDYWLRKGPFSQTILVN
jgi:L-iduronidase